MSKVAILTEYWDSENYGGVLQAYALCRVINEMGHPCEQVQYLCTSTKINTERKRSPLLRRVKKALNPVELMKYFQTVHERKLTYNRKMAFVRFRDTIPHTDNAYADDDILECIDMYDCFITGSDQVWNPNFYHPSYYLTFVPSDKVKMSYAASMAVPKLKPEDMVRYEKNLADFDLISVREKSSVDMLAPLVRIPVEWVLDPVLLLSAVQWDTVASGRRIKEKYIFTYFFGISQEQRVMIEKFAKRKKLKLVSMPLLYGSYKKSEKAYGDIKLYDVSPEDFISLIRGAEYVFTDSFHVSVFACIYQKPFFAFPRMDHADMNERLYSLTELFQIEERFCDIVEKQNLGYLEAQPKIQWEEKQKKYLQMREKSLAFLKKGLELR